MSHPNVKSAERKHDKLRCGHCKGPVKIHRNLVLHESGESCLPEIQPPENSPNSLTSSMLDLHSRADDIRYVVALGEAWCTKRRHVKLDCMFDWSEESWQVLWDEEHDRAGINSPADWITKAILPCIKAALQEKGYKP